MKTSNMIKCAISILGFSLVFLSCVSSKNVSKNNVFYKLDKTAGNDVLHKYLVTKSFRASITDKGGYITIKPDAGGVINGSLATQYVSPSTIPIPVAVTGTDAVIQASGSYFFKKTDFDTNVNKRNKFAYQDSRFMLQSLTIPLKVRPKINNHTGGTDIPKQVESGFNFGFATGWKFSHNSYRSQESIFGMVANKFSIAPGVLLNFGATTLNDKNTFPAFVSERKAFTYSGGLVVMMGINNVSFGVVRARDWVTGQGKKDWIYQGKSWTGIIVALDLLK